jgi:hypothetical protein
MLAVALATIAAAVAVTIDGGNAFAEQRSIQNGTDAAALAGAVALGNYGSCTVNGCARPTDAQINAAINNAAGLNNITVSAAYYTDVCGTPLKPSGQAATGSGGQVNLSAAARVGAGTIPPDLGTEANCSNGTSGPTAGVLIHFGHRDVSTYVAGVVGINSFSIDTQATAVSTYGTCGAQQGCALLPIAFPRNITTCDKNSKAVNAGLGPYLTGIVYVVPLCSNSPGNVGWLDWTPKGGGISPIDKPDNSPITFPSWQYVAQSGGPNSAPVQAKLRALGGTVARIVMFDHTCGGGSDPDSSYPRITDPSRWYGCSQAGFDGGNGSNLWYRLPLMMGFVGCLPSLPECQFNGHAYETAYTSGNNKSTCDQGNGATQCLVGKFVDLEYGNDGSNGAPVQLIK